MLLTQSVWVKWHGFTKKYYVNLGYKFTKIGEYFEVKIQDLPKGSHAIVEVQCDYCGIVVEKEYRRYLEEHDDELGDCCGKCNRIKSNKSWIERYGGIGLQSKQIKDKAQKTNKIKYGCKAPMQNKEIYEKVRKTQEEKYGGIGLQSPITRKKIEERNLELRGVKYPAQDEKIREKQRNTLKEKYGVEHPLQFLEFKEKAIVNAMKTRQMNGTFVSKPEKIITDMLKELYGEENCLPSFPVGRLSLDCLLIIENIKIDVEYDGWYWHKNRQEEDRRRNYTLLNLGYKVLRIKSKYEIPTKEQIIEAINTLITEDKHYTEIILDI